jgi:hypothetical protein
VLDPCGPGTSPLYLDAWSRRAIVPHAKKRLFSVTFVVDTRVVFLGIVELRLDVNSIEVGDAFGLHRL